MSHNVLNGGRERLCNPSDYSTISNLPGRRASSEAVTCPWNRVAYAKKNQCQQSASAMLITNPNVVMPDLRPTPVFPVEPVDRPGASRPVGAKPDIDYRLRVAAWFDLLLSSLDIDNFY